MKSFSIAGLVCVLCLCEVLFGGVYGGGGGTEESPYLISDPLHWQALSATPDDWALHFRLTANINMNQMVVSPVGTDDDPFIGVIDGQNFALENLAIDLPAAETVGVFGYISGSAQIKNLRVLNVNIKGRKYVGGFVAYNGTPYITNCSVTGTVSGTERYIGGFAGSNYRPIADCYAQCNVSGTSYVGGFAGDNEGSLLRCHAEGHVTGTADEIGGLAGYSNCSITNSSAAGTVSGTKYVGGLVGRNDEAMVLDSFSSAAVSSTSDYCGGLVGYIREESIVQRCYAAGTVAGNRYAGGLAGISRGTILASYSTGSVSGIEYLGGAVGFLSSPAKLENVYATGAVSGPEYRGGLVGFNSRGKVIHCYATGQLTGEVKVGGLCGYVLIDENYEDRGNFWDTDTSQLHVSAMGTGRETEVMQTLSTYIDAGWDFANETANGTNDYWRLCDDDTAYPKLSWQFSSGDIVCPEGVNLDDFNFLAQCWQQAECTGILCGRADLNGDGSVQLEDLLLFAGEWLTF